MGAAGSGHQPVLTDRVLALLGPALDRPGAVVLDATLGRAGHAAALLREHPGVSLIGVDTDPAAIEASRARLAAYADRVTLVHAVYDQIPAILARLGLPSVQGVLLDLGVSSPQLDDRDRGFAYSYDAPLDMRMDTGGPLTAADVVNTYSAADLARVLRDYGEERFARRIADAVVRARAAAPLHSTLQLSEIVRDSIPAPARRTRRQPGQAHLPGAADRGERRARRAGPGAARGPRRARRGRPDRRAGLSLAGGPAGEEGPRGPLGGHHAARPAGPAALGPARVPAADPGCRASRLRRKPRPTRGPPRPGCGPPSGSGKRHDRGGRTTRTATGRGPRPAGFHGNQDGRGA